MRAGREMSRWWLEGRRGTGCRGRCRGRRSGRRRWRQRREWGVRVEGRLLRAEAFSQGWGLCNTTGRSAGVSDGEEATKWE